MRRVLLGIVAAVGALAAIAGAFGYAQYRMTTRYVRGEQSWP